MADLLDADVLIRAKNLHYGFDFCPGFWDWIVLAHRAGIVRSVEKVGDELRAVQDQLSEWAKVQGSGFFAPVGPDDVRSLGRVSDWVKGQSYEAAAVGTFLQTADYYLVSQAATHGYTVVTHEVPSATRRKVKIPNACIGIGVKCMTPFEMLRVERARFVLEDTGFPDQRTPSGLFVEKAANPSPTSSPPPVNG